jgi:hypothetical protein
MANATTHQLRKGSDYSSAPEGVTHMDPLKITSSIHHLSDLFAWVMLPAAVVLLSFQRATKGRGSFELQTRSPFTKAPSFLGPLLNHGAP